MSKNKSSVSKMKLKNDLENIALRLEGGLFRVSFFFSYKNHPKLYASICRMVGGKCHSKMFAMVFAPGLGELRHHVFFSSS